MIKEIEKIILPITEFRHDMTRILDTLNEPRILMNRDKAKAVIVPYELYKAMETVIEDKMDEFLASEAAERLNDSEAAYLTHNKFWEKLGVE